MCEGNENKFIMKKIINNLVLSSPAWFHHKPWRAVDGGAPVNIVKVIMNSAIGDRSRRLFQCRHDAHPFFLPAESKLKDFA